MPCYYIPNMNPEVVCAPTPLEAAVFSGIWESGGWADEYEALGDHRFDREYGHATIPVMEIDAHGEQVGSPHRVEIGNIADAIRLLDAFGPGANKRLEDY